jgi:hypothetical protein
MQALRPAHLIGLVLLGLSFPASAQQPVAVETGQPQRARASFTSEIIDREPVDRLAELSNDGQVIYFHTELLGLGGSEVIHRWEFNGQTMAEVPFRVGADRWRVWSSKRLDRVWLGDWTAKAVTADGMVLASETFRYTAAVPAAPAAPAAAQETGASEAAGQ